MKFSIITPTFKRPLELSRGIKSVIDQNYQNWEMIIVNDSPEYNYEEFENSEYRKDDRIKYFKNPKNMGVNYSRNFALENIADDSNYIIFLDDDDWLAKEALFIINKLLENNKIKWLITNRSIGNKSIVKVNKKKEDYIYVLDILIMKNLSGDMTHAISKDLATKQKFSKKVKNGEEWIYFIKIKSKALYMDINTTESYGYSYDGLTSISKDAYNKNTKLLWGENKNIEILFILIFRSLKILVKKLFSKN